MSTTTTTTVFPDDDYSLGDCSAEVITHKAHCTLHLGRWLIMHHKQLRLIDALHKINALAINIETPVIKAVIKVPINGGHISTVYLWV